MVTKRNVILLLSAVAVAGVLVVGYWFVLRSQPELCAACERRINEKARAVVEVSGKREPVCCVRCGLTIERQEHQRVRLIGNYVRFAADSSGTLFGWESSSAHPTG